MGKESTDKWPIAVDREKRFRIFMSGPPGCFKTRVMLGLGDNANAKEPALAVIDTEFGTDHYGNQFAFRRLKENDPAVIKAEIKDLIDDPGKVVTLGIDSFSVYYEALMDEWVDRFLKRELTSKGFKGEYYTLQPRDYVHINRSASKVVRMLLESDLNLICVCQVKDKWEDMKIVGSIFDGWKRLPYYFDTIIEINEGKDGWKAFLKGKDRSGCLVPGQEIPWKDDQKIVEYLAGKFGQKLVGSVETDEVTSEKLEKKKKAAKKKPEKPADAPKETPPDATAEPEEKEPEPAVEAEEAHPEEQTAPPEVDKSGVINRNKLIEIVRLKAEAQINDPKAWAAMVAKYNKVENGKLTDKPLTTAKELTMDQAEEFLRDLVRVKTNPT